MSETLTTGRQVMQAEPPAAQPTEYKAEMSFLDHLEELRWRIFKGVIGVGVGVVVAFIFSDFIINKILLGPVREDFIIYTLLGLDAVTLTLQNRVLPGQFFTYIGSLIVVGIILGTPVLFFQMWKFLEPALELKEKKNAFFIVAFITLSFFTGVSFGYFILTPFALQFFATFQISEVVRNDFDINAYFSSLTMWIFACGVIFQTPFISYFLSKIGILTPEALRKHRKIAIIVCFILGAFLTPPDPVSQFLIAVPLILLYQLGIWISAVVNRKRNAEIFGKPTA